MKALAFEANTNSAWTLLGATGAVAGLLILSFYSVAAGWALSYVFNGFQNVTAESSTQSFNSLLASPTSNFLAYTLFISHGICSCKRDLEGLEKWINTLMSMLFVLVILLCLYATQSGAFVEGLIYLFQPDFSKITPSYAGGIRTGFYSEFRYGSYYGLRSLYASKSKYR